LIVLAVGLLAAAVVAVRRVHHEAQARNVEIVMDDADFSSLAASYGYDQRTFLRALHSVGLTSLGVSEELGGGVSTSSGGAVYTGATLLDQARIGALGDPFFRALARAGKLRSDDMYLIAYDAPTAARYRTQLALKFSPNTVRVLRASLPAVFAVRTASDYFQSVGLGLPIDRIDLARRSGLVLAPRLQNDEGFKPEAIDALVASATQGEKVRTLIFFGLRNEVLGYPTQIDATADLFKRTKLNFGDIETYDPKQIQVGTDELARKIPGRVVRVQAISKVEQDKLKPEEIVERYLLGVHERNIRVVYLRPFAHRWDLGNGKPPLSIQATNVEIVKRIADGIKRDGLRLGGASPIVQFTIQWWLVLAASLAVPAMFLLLLDTFGVRGSRLAGAIIAADIAFVLAGYLVHHDLAARKLIALAAGVLFPVAGLAAIAPAFRETREPGTFGAAFLAGLRVMGVALGVTLAGALVIVGVLTTPMTMIEVDKFLGVKLVLLAPPLIGLVLYLLTPLWGAKLEDTSRAMNAPVRFYQLGLGLVVIVAAYILQARSGNQSDIAPSSFELALRAHLTSILTVRPRFKEFLAGFPALVLLPALRLGDRTWAGWLFVLAIGIGLGDVIDTFSHLHTPLPIGLLRLVNGAVLGAGVGAVALAVYRRWR
jgi:hypothetical protein